jgi:murein DD-endopeptidase MepM/ murein hydrolase activator NlpD
MPSKKISLLLISSTSKSVKNFAISPVTIYVTLSVMVILFTVSIAWGISYFRTSFDYAELDQLRTENEFLVQRLSEMEVVVDQIKGRMEEIVERDDRIRMVFDIPEVDSETRQLGTGGTLIPEVMPINVNTADNLYELQNEIQTLLKSSEFENASFAAILDEVASKKYLLDHTPSILPCDGYYSRGFGMKPDPFTGNIQMHAGIDIASDKGTPVIASADGTVNFTGWIGRFGRVVIIDHGFGYRTLYGHLESMNVKKGQSVKRWQTIGTMGSTGRSTGPHLHYEVHKDGRPVDPMPFVLTRIKKIF